MDQQGTRTDITVNVEMAVMREQGIVSGELNEVNEQVAARIRVLAAPDLEVVALQSRGKLLYGVVDDEHQPAGSRDIPDNEFRVVLTRRGQHRVSAVRVGSNSVVFITPAGLVFAPSRLSDQNPSKVFASHSPATHTWPGYGTGQRNRVNNRVRIKLAGCLAPDAAPTDCRDVAVLGGAQRARRNRLGKKNIGAARRNRATLGGYHDQPRPTNLSDPRDRRIGSRTRGLCEVFGSAAIAVLGGHRSPETSSVGR
jgi:hypothetical protein